MHTRNQPDGKLILRAIDYQRVSIIRYGQRAMKTIERMGIALAMLSISATAAVFLFAFGVI
jgi:hypothetical protein